MPKEPQPLNYEAIPVFPDRLVILNEDRIIYNFKRLAKLNPKLFLLPGIQGRSQEETTTEANTRSAVRNQPYEIF